MASFELSKLQGVTSVRPLAESDRAQLDARARQVAAADDSTGAKPGVSLEVGTNVDTSTPPVDNERVQKIRKALQDGSYPLVPTKIADAIIAARFSFEAGAQ